jgi:transmembrane sensor
MSNLHSMPSNQDRHDQASDWIVKMDRGLSSDEKIALQEWMDDSPENHSTLMQMTQLWDKMNAMTRLSDLFPKPTRHASQTQTQRSNLIESLIENWTKSWLKPLPAIAASIALATVLGLWAILGNVDNNNNSYQTAIGEQSTVMLPDGTKMTLNTNTNTSVTVAYSDQQRLLHLIQGELHVSVAKDKNRPLSVMAGGKVIQAIGTEFNIEITSQQKIELVVTEGKVKVGIQQKPEKQIASIEPLTLPSDALTVSAGEEIMLGEAKEQITEVSAEDIAVKLSWQKGNLIFRGESLEEAVREVGRYTSVEFVFIDENLKKMRVAGLFQAGDVQGLLATLRENFDIVSQRDGNGKVLLSGKK